MTQHETTPDSQDARSRLISAALRLFAEKGYEAATTREISEAAGANVSAIRYYFGDKAGLYRATFTEPMADLPCPFNRQTYVDLPLAEALRVLIRDFLEPLKRGEDFRLVMKLHYREMIEPTGAWQDKIDAEIKPHHEALVSILGRHLGLENVDIDLHRLAFAIMGMAVYFYVAQDVVSAILPAMLADTEAIDFLADRLAGYALSMVEREAQRRAEGAPDGAD